MVIDHIGIVVRSLQDGISSWANAFGYTQLTEPVVNSRQKVKVVFLQKSGSTMVKLMEPTDSSSPVFALSSRGGGLHHLCFRTSDMEGSLQHLQNQGARVIVAPEPGEAFENEPIAFVYANGLPTEIIATERKARVVAAEK